MHSRILRIASLLVLLATPSFQGCSMWNRWRGEENRLGEDMPARDAAKLETEFRPKSQKSEAYFFFDERARQIERNLGM